MNNEGFGSNGAAFDYVVTKEGKTRTRRRALLVLAYVLWVVVFFGVGVISRLALPLLCFIPLSLWILVFLTWRWSKEEIKMSFLGGGLTVIRMYDGRNPKKLFEARLKDITLVTRYSEEKLAEYGKREVVCATRTEELSGAYMAVWDGKIAVFEPNERVLKIIKYYCDGESYDV